MRLKFKRSLKLGKLVAEGRVMGIPCKTYFVVSIQDGIGLKFSRCVPYGQKIKVPKDITGKLTEDERDLLDGIRKYVGQKKQAPDTANVEGCATGRDL